MIGLSCHACGAGGTAGRLSHAARLRSGSRSTRYTNADLGLLVDAMREVLDVLPAVGFHVIPAGIIVLKIIPRFLLVAGLRALLPSKFMEVGGMYHLSQAPDEMRQLCMELMAMVEKSGLPVPALRSCLRQADEMGGK